MSTLQVTVSYINAETGQRPTGPFWPIRILHAATIWQQYSFSVL